MFNILLSVVSESFSGKISCPAPVVTKFLKNCRRTAYWKLVALLKASSFTESKLLYMCLSMEFDIRHNIYCPEYTDENPNMKQWVNVTKNCRTWKANTKT